MLQAWRPGDSLQESFVSFHRLSSGDQTKGAGISSKGLTLLAISPAALASFSIILITQDLCIESLDQVDFLCV